MPVHHALQLTERWPVDNVSAAVISADGVATSGDQQLVYRLASLAKLLLGWTAMVAVEEGVVALADPIGQPECTLHHLLAHAGGYAFDGPDPITRPGRRRIYSNTGIEMVAEHIGARAGMPFARYLHEALLDPLEMRATELRGSPAHGVWSTCDDMARFLRELITPTLITADSALLATTPAFPELAGIIPGLGKFDPCPWGLTFEVRGAKSPHWTGACNSPATFGHFGGAGTFLWVDRGAAGAPRERASTSAVGCVVLTDRPFDDWAAQALELWPAFSDAVLAEAAAG